MAALLSVALSLVLAAPVPAHAAGIGDVVQPCEGASRDDYFNYCCKRRKRIRVAVIPDFQSTGYAENFMEAADDIFGPHNIEFSAQVLQVDGMRELTQAANMAELCRSALIQLGPHMGDGFRFRV